ncbi:Rho termination factor N-terminal domain-containing protein, partial [Flavobacterium lindanitolerans]|uniref:Rho termination factor N-terminal domain-containing protein n=1 Tax=Flavobacterium lindanitolerans TaxID=428988 RepID=UPI0028096C65
MFDISVLKEMKLSELQDIAKATKKIKINGVKKEALIYQILDYQAANPEVIPAPAAETEAKPKRARIIPEKKTKVAVENTNTLFSEPEPTAVSEQPIQEKKKPLAKQPVNPAKTAETKSPDAVAAPTQKDKKQRFNKNNFEKPQAAKEETAEK